MTTKEGTSIRARVARAARALFVCGLLTCADTGIALLPDDGGAAADAAEDTDDIESFVQAGLYADFLFIVDNSSRMHEEQALLAEAAPDFVAALEAAHLDYRIGVLSTDVGTGSYAWPESGCREGTGDGGRLRGPIVAPTDGKPGIALRTNLMLGTDGCGFERPLDSLMLALADADLIAKGSDFFRRDAVWALIFVTDEDDCSAQDELYDPDRKDLGFPNLRCFLWAKSSLMRSVTDTARTVGKYRRSHTQLTLIAGAPEPVLLNMSSDDLAPSCSVGKTEARPPIRLASFTASLGGAHSSICTDDLGPALDGAMRRATAPIRSYCLKKPTDTGHCVLSERRRDGSTRVIPPRGAKSMTSAGWWFSRPTSPGCEHGAFMFDETAVPEAGSYVDIRCRPR